MTRKFGHHLKLTGWFLSENRFCVGLHDPNDPELTGSFVIGQGSTIAEALKGAAEKIDSIEDQWRADGEPERIPQWYLENVVGLRGNV